MTRAKNPKPTAETYAVLQKACEKSVGMIEWRDAPIAAFLDDSKCTKYTCGCCGTSAYGKPRLNIHCGDCEEPMYS